MWVIIKIELRLELASNSHLLQAVMADGAIMSNKKTNNQATSVCFQWIDVMGGSPDSFRNPLEELGRYNRSKVCHRIKWVSCSAVRVYMQKPTHGSSWHWDVNVYKVLKLFVFFLACRKTLVLMVEMVPFSEKTREKAPPLSIQRIAWFWCWRFGAIPLGKQDFSLTLGKQDFSLKWLNSSIVSNLTAMYSCIWSPP